MKLERGGGVGWGGVRWVGGWANHLLVDSLNESTNLDQEHKKHQAKKNSKDELCV